MARFVKGNPGRPKGSVNKVHAKAKEFLLRVNDALEAVIFEDLMTIDPEDRVKLWLALQEYIMPKLSRQEITGIEQPKTELTVNLSKLSNDDLERLEELAQLARDQEGESEEGV
jgi:hypothetical protein